VVLDKPESLTSFDCVRTLRGVLGVRRVGHGGTLDPFATGVLVCGVGAATRLLSFLLEGEKEYVADLRFGIATDSLDRTGEVVERRAPRFSPADLEAACAEFVGEHMQVPPRLSAVKVEGQRSHRRFRRGDKDFELEPRPVRIHTIEVLESGLERARVRVVCDGGTYVRSLARDLGQRLDTVAHVAELRRTRVGPFSLQDAISPDELRAQWPNPRRGVHPVADLVRSWPTLSIDESQALRLRQGQQPDESWLELPEPSATRVAFLDERGEVVAVAQRDAEQLRLRVVLPAIAEEHA
jgi:tRNA pseudouridine55 synthase